jgi:hypothetical protein
MWPKVLMELLPHVSRLIPPVADRYFASKGSAGGVNDATVALADALQADLGQVASAHAGLYRVVQEQGNQIADVTEEVRRARRSLEQYDHRLETIDRRLASLNLWLKAGISLLTILVIVVLVLLLKK